MITRLLSLGIAFGVVLARGASPAGPPVHRIDEATIVREWLVCGPFPNPLATNVQGAAIRAGYDTDYLADIGGEAGCRPAPGMTVAWEGTTCVFTPYAATSATVNLDELIGGTYRACYLFTLLEADADQDVFLHIGSDDGAKVYLDGALVHSVYGDRGARAHESIVAARLRKGRTPLLVKVEQGVGGWALILDVCDGTRHAAYVRTAARDTLRANVAQSGSLGRALALSVTSSIPVGSVFNDLDVTWRLTDERGQAVMTTVMLFQSTLHFSAPAAPGFYTVEMAVPALTARHATACIIAEDATGVVASVLADARRWCAATTNEIYAGWIAYLLWQAERSGEHCGPTAQESVAAVDTLRRWLARVALDPLPGMRGPFEWAYLSKVDRSGQPFFLFVPEHYDPARSWPLRLTLHGMGGTHLPYAPPESRYTNDHLTLQVLGRARAGGYVKLSEVDVLDALAFVRRHWRIDPDRIWLSGGSMGGGGTFYIGSRHPCLFASAQPNCGYGAHVPIENMLNLPVFSAHSDDDWTVPIVYSRIPLRALAKLGGRAIQYEATGYGHGIGSCAASQRAAREWESKQVRPSRVPHIRFTAIDGFARRAYWAEIVEWGPRARPASFDVRAGQDNTLYAALDNVGILALDLANAPVDRSRALDVVVGTIIVTNLPAPLPARIWLTMRGDACVVTVQPPPAPPIPRHFPGGIAALYQGEPLLIVWGTQGTTQETAVLRALAERCSRFSSPRWDKEVAEPPMYEMLFGRLPAKPDTEVTDAEIQSHNLFLLGTPAQNSLVARIAGALPVQINGGRVTCSDGAEYAFTNRALGLLHYNPLAPQRLVFWLAVDSGTRILQPYRWQPAVPDFVLAGADGAPIVAQRSFTSDWSWQPGYAASPLVPAELCSASNVIALGAAAMRWATASDFALVVKDQDARAIAFAPNETRWMDALGLPFEEHLVTFELSGAELLRQATALTNAPTAPGDEPLQFLPPILPGTIQPDLRYRVVAQSGWVLGDYTTALHERHIQANLCDLTLQDVLDRYRPRASAISPHAAP